MKWQRNEQMRLLCSAFSPHLDSVSLEMAREELPDLTGIQHEVQNNQPDSDLRAFSEGIRLFV